MLTARHKALAAEALIRHPDLTPAARRVGLELLNHADRRTGTSWPSEARMAEALGVDPRTIRRGKIGLKAAGLLVWDQRGHHRTPVYRLLWDKLVQLAGKIKTRLQTACKAARAAFSTAKASVPPLPEKPASDGPTRPSGRTFSSAYLTHQGLKRAGEGKRGQILSDQQLDTKAQARLYAALKALGHAAMVKFFDHPDAARLEAEAVRAERYSPAQGRTGLAVIARAIA